MEERAECAVRAAGGDHFIHKSATKSSWCVLEAELEGQATSASLWGVVLEPLAPRTERQVLKRRVVLVPLSDHLPEVLVAESAELRHLRRGVLLQL